MHKDHPNLSPDINRNIHESELAGGVWLNVPDWADSCKDTEPLLRGKTVLVQTKHNLYTIEHREDGDYIKGHRKYCLDFTKVNIHGSTWGGSMLKVGFIGIGMHLEFSVPGYGTITTSEIQSVEVL